MNKKTLRLVIGLQLVWISTLTLLGIWWAQVIDKQSDQIAALESKLGQAPSNWSKVQRMLFWESATFYVLLVGVTGLILWFLWRDVKRGKRIQSFFASLTHELRTPLTSIRLQAETIAEEAPEENHDHEHLSRLTKRLLEDTERLEAQVDRTLELARLEGGGTVFLQPLDLSSSVRRSIANWNDRASIKIDLHHDLIQADPGAIEVVIRNLVENSVRHSGRKDDLAIELTSKKAGNWVQVHYKDNGRTFSGDQESLGELFHKGSSSTGTGVGLYLVKTLMTKMGGRAVFNTTSGFEADLVFLSPVNKAGESAHV